MPLSQDCFLPKAEQAWRRQEPANQIRTQSFLFGVLKVTGHAQDFIYKGLGKNESVH